MEFQGESEILQLRIPWTSLTKRKDFKRINECKKCLTSKLFFFHAKLLVDIASRKGCLSALSLP
jgi:hypothetical protein